MPKRILEGVVVSDKGDKTVVVKVERTFLHPVLKKTVRRSKKYHAHDEANTYKAGEVARIQERTPKLKTKTWDWALKVSTANPWAPFPFSISKLPGSSRLFPTPAGSCASRC